MKPKIIVKAGVPKGYMEPEEADSWIDYKKAKAAAIAEAKEFEDVERIVDRLPSNAFRQISDNPKKFKLKDGTYDSLVGWVEVEQRIKGGGKRTILRLVEKEPKCKDIRVNGGFASPDCCKDPDNCRPADLGAGQEKIKIPYYTQEDEIKALKHQVTHMNEVYGAAQIEYVNRIKGLLAHIESDKTVIAELSKALEATRAFIKEFRDNAAEAGELQFTPKFFQNCDNVIRGYSLPSQENQPDETQEELFPLANDENKRGGWIHDFPFMEDIQKYAEGNGESISLEAIDLVLDYVSKTIKRK